MKRPILFLTAFCWIGLAKLSAQSAITVSGGDATGSGGNSSYSIGQIDYTSKGSPVQITEGVQQPYEIVSLSISEEISQTDILLYPNPVKDVLYVDFQDKQHQSAAYQVFDLQGRLVKEGIFGQSKSEITFRDYPRSTYIIRITQNGKFLQSFKIIKK